MTKGQRDRSSNWQVDLYAMDVNREGNAKTYFAALED